MSLAGLFRREPPAPEVPLSPIERKKLDLLSLIDLAKLDAELRDDATPAERRKEIATRIKAAKDALEVLSERPEGDRAAFELCRGILIAEEQRERAALDRAREETYAALRAKRKEHRDGRPDRFHALPPMRQALLIAKAAAAEHGAAAGFGALDDALARQGEGEDLPVPFTFETTELPLGEIRRLASAGAIDQQTVDAVERANMQEGSWW
jgi:hypothetical protein